MKDLIERLEKAEGPNFELDCAIFEEMLPTEMFGSKVSSWFRSDDTHYYGCNTEDGYRHLDCLRAPNYTGSVDAALTLVPELDRPRHGCWWSIQQTVGSFGSSGVFYHAELLVVVGEQYETTHGFNASPAISLCIAALKARVHLRDASEQKAVSPEGADGPRHMEACRG